MLAYNTSYHSTIATTPFELLFGVRPRLPSLPAPEIQRVQYGESFPAERLQLLQHARQVARQHAEAQGIKYKQNFDSTTAPHSFKIFQKVWLSDTTALGKNPKLMPKWLGPYKIVDLNDNNAKLEIKTNKFKIVNCSRLKPFLESQNTSVCPEENRLFQGDPGLFQDTNTNLPDRPLTRALKNELTTKMLPPLPSHFYKKILSAHTPSQKITLNFVVTNVTMLSNRWTFPRIQTFVKNTEI
jgi:hypothetical protein